jgi:hypothetical protein
MTKTLNRLQAGQNFQLAKWWDTHAQQFEKLRQHEIAELATRDLGFLITACNIAAAMKVTGKRNNPPRTPPSSTRPHGDRLRVVARELAALMGQLDVTPSPAFLQVLSGAPKTAGDTQPVRPSPAESSVLRRFIRGETKQ